MSIDDDFAAMLRRRNMTAYQLAAHYRHIWGGGTTGHHRRIKRYRDGDGNKPIEMLERTCELCGHELRIVPKGAVVNISDDGGDAA